MDFGGAWGANKLFGGGAKAATTAAPLVRGRDSLRYRSRIAGGATAAAGLGMSEMLFGTSALSLAGSASIAAAPFLAGGYAANKYNEAHADTSSSF